MIRTTVRVDTQMYDLAQGQDVGAIEEAAVEAARAGGGLVTFVVVGNRAVSALVTSGVPVLFEEHEVPEDDRDTGDPGDPYPPDLDDLDL